MPNHLDQTAVTFIGSLTRQKVVDGVVVVYFRNTFEIDGKTHAVSSAVDMAGLDGKVQFVKKGEKHPSGTGEVAQDAYSLVEVVSIQALRNRLDSVKLKREREALG
jgi:hypothetical protein